MLIDASLEFDELEMGRQARRLETEGFDGVWAPETGHDFFSVLGAAANSTTRFELGTGIVVAFGRSPMISVTAKSRTEPESDGG